MITAFALFVSTFVLVCALGLQSLNVNRGHYWWAFFTSFLISAAQMVLLKLAPDATWLEIAGYMSGGPFGIVTAMHLQPWLTRKPPERRSKSRFPWRAPPDRTINRVIFKKGSDPQ